MTDTLTLGDYYKDVARRLKADHGWKQGPYHHSSSRRQGCRAYS